MGSSATWGTEGLKGTSQQFAEHTLKEQFDLERIRASLCEFQRDFDAINALLALHREPLETEMIDNIVAAYDFLNDLLTRDVDLFSVAGLHSLLELNHIVLCGIDPRTRHEYHRHIVETRKRFHRRIRKVRTWVEKHVGALDPFDLAAGFYTKSLSQPQLFVEGNHRTENIVLNYLLICQERAPLVISSENARAYLDLSGEIKFTQREKFSTGKIKLRGYRREFSEFLARHTRATFVVGGAL